MYFCDKNDERENDERVCQCIQTRFTHWNFFFLTINDTMPKFFFLLFLFTDATSCCLQWGENGSH